MNSIYNFFQVHFWPCHNLIENFISFPHFHFYFHSIKNIWFWQIVTHERKSISSTHFTHYLFLLLLAAIALCVYVYIYIHNLHNIYLPKALTLNGDGWLLVCKKMFFSSSIATIEFSLGLVHNNGSFYEGILYTK